MKSNGLHITVSLKTQEQSFKWIYIFYYLNFVVATIYLAMCWVQFFNPTHYAYIVSTTVYTFSLTAYNVLKEYSRKIYGSRLKKKNGGIWFFLWLVNIAIMLYWQFNSYHYIGVETWSGFTMIVTNYILAKIVKHYKRKNGVVQVV